MASLCGQADGVSHRSRLCSCRCEPADAAKARKHKKHVTARAATVTVNSRYRGTNLFPAGPIYNGTDYLGDDPDPIIRFQILRDLGAHYGGEN